MIIIVTMTWAPVMCLFPRGVSASLQCDGCDPTDEETGHEPGGEPPEPDTDTDTDCAEQVATPRDGPRGVPRRSAGPTIRSALLGGVHSTAT